MAIVATVQDLAEQQTEELANKFAGILKSVVPDVTKSLAKTAESFQKALLTGSDQKIQKAYGDLKGFLNTFDVNISDLGEGFRDTEKVFKSLTDQFEDTNEKIQGLREKNIFAEKELFVNKKNNNLEVRATILTDQQLFEKRQKILAKEKELKDKDKNLLEQVRQVQTGENEISDKQNANLTQDFQKNRDELKNIQELKKLYSGKGGLAVNLLDRFERSLEDNAPSFLVAAFAPIIDIARQFQKTFGLLVSGIKSTAKFIGRFLPDSVKEGFANVMKPITSGFKSFGKSLKMASIGLLKFVKRIFLAGMALLLGIITPLLPIIIPMLKFAGIVIALVAGFLLLEKGLNALTDWFKNSWLGKKLGLDDESQEIKDKQDRAEGTGKYQGLEGETDLDPFEVPQKTKDVKRLKKIDFFDKEIFGKSKIDRSKIDQASTNELKSLLATESDDLKPKDIKFIQDKIIEKEKFVRGKDMAPDFVGKDYENEVSSIKPDTKIAEGIAPNKFKKPDIIKKDLKGGGESLGNTTTTVVNSQPSSNETKVNNTNMLVPINTSSGDNYFDRLANNIHY